MKVDDDYPEIKIKPFRISTEDVQASEVSIQQSRERTDNDIRLFKNKLPYTTWFEMVTHYSQRSITFPTDRLPALAGIAEDTAALLNDTYASGIWKGDLHNGLLYQSKGVLESCKEPPVPRPLWEQVPSWSWASLNTPIHFTTARRPPDTVKLCEISIIPSTESHLSMLEMRGPLMRLDWVKTSADAVQCQSFWDTDWEDPIFHRTAGYRDDATWEVHTQEDHWFAQKCYSEFCSHPIPDKHGELSEKPYFDALFDNVFFMPVLFEDKREPVLMKEYRQLSPWSRIIGILLWAEGGQAPGVFRRVGAAQLNARKAGKAVALFEERAGTYQVGIGEESYCRTDENGEYTILVV